MKSKIIILLLFMLWQTLEPSVYKGQSIDTEQPEKIITGAIIDDSGSPVKGSLIRLYFRDCQDCVDYVLLVDKTSSDGSFYLKAKTNSKKALIFIDDIEPDGYFSPLFYLPEVERQKISVIKGKRVSLFKRMTSLGKIKQTWRYGRIIVDLSSIFGNSSENFVGNINLKIKDENGKIIDEGFLTKSAFDKTLTRLKIALPVHGSKTIWLLRVEYSNPFKGVEIFEYKLHLMKLDCKSLSLKNGEPVEFNCN